MILEYNKTAWVFKASAALNNGAGEAVNKNRTTELQAGPGWKCFGHVSNLFSDFEIWSKIYFKSQIKVIPGTPERLFYEIYNGKK